ncbi:MAG TPA: M24 family metallopeptidase, partial [bacterium]|nr:M24 family metallopeptidase [bacterium]
TPTSMVVNGLRAIKDEFEVATMRKAIAIGDQALAAVLPYCKPGVTENQIITRYLHLVRELGAEGPSYEPIFGAGPNAAIIHHRGSDRPLEPGDVLLVDAGVKYQGYCSDMTRVFFIEREDPEMKAIYEVVLRAHLHGYEVTGDGVPAREVDLQTRAIIEEAGYGDYYGHSLGHGIGLDVHESPRVSKLSEDTLQTGMLHTIEPGIYIPGKGGIRVEDICYLSPDGPERLTGSPKEMLVLQY